MIFQFSVNLTTTDNWCSKTRVDSCPAHKYLDERFRSYASIIFYKEVEINKATEVSEHLQKIQEICVNCQKKHQKTK